jgi:glycosyltransferase involved in cell wall biosynthesis
MITICIPTYKTEQETRKQIEDIKSSVSSSPVEIFASCQDGSAAHNRNYCLNKAKGEIIIMLDDDITGFFPGWDKILIKPLLEDNLVSIVSARLINKDGTPSDMMYDNQKYEPGYYPSLCKIVPAACIALKKTSMRFDENFAGSGFEDTDFCKQMAFAFPKKHTIINNDCKLIHVNERKNQDSMRTNRRYFVSKWGWVHHPKKMDKTIIYYTGNREDEAFENKIRDNILRVKGNLPIISVSQKPMDFGTNICVGDVGQSYLNAFRQLLIGCEAATTHFVVMAESDCLYPKTGYFDFTPTDPNIIYSYSNTWIMWKREGRNSFRRKEQTHAGMIYGREFLIKLLKKSFEGLPMWSREKMGFPFYKPEHKFQEFRGEDPIINIITGANGRKSTTLMKDQPRDSFPYWGSVVELKKKLFYE